MYFFGKGNAINYLEQLAAIEGIFHKIALIISVSIRIIYTVFLGYDTRNDIMVYIK